MEQNLIYALYCPVINKPVYVGQTTQGLDRPFEHVKERSHNKKVNEWVNHLKEQGTQPTVVILEHTLDSSLLNDKEQYWINNFLTKGNILLNQKNVTSQFFVISEFDKDLDDSDYLADVRLFIKARRKIMGLTQPELAEKAGIGLRFLRELESGYKTNFNTDTLIKLLQFLGRVKLKLEFV
jgi:hypothetical protein